MTREQFTNLVYKTIDEKFNAALAKINQCEAIQELCIINYELGGEKAVTAFKKTVYYYFMAHENATEYDFLLEFYGAFKK